MTLTNLDALALDDLSVACLVIELQSVGIELEMLLLPSLEERTSELEHFSLHDTVRRHHCNTVAIQYKAMQCNAMQCNAMQCNTVRRHHWNTIQYNLSTSPSTIQSIGTTATRCQYNTIRYDTIKYITIQSVGTTATVTMSQYNTIQCSFSASPSKKGHVPEQYPVHWTVQSTLHPPLPRQTSGTNSICHYLYNLAKKKNSLNFEMVPSIRESGILLLSYRSPN